MKFVVFDIETTGLDVQKERIVEIGAIKVIDGEVVDEFEMFLKTDIPIPPQVSMINNIYNHMLEDAELPGVVLYRFYQFYKDCDFLVGHNAKRFDYPFLEFEFDRHFVKYDPIEVKDTVHLGRRKVKGLRSYSLSSLCRIFNINNENAHRALSDVYATYKVFVELQKR